MFLGHFGVALAAKKVAPRPGWLFVAWAYWIDRHRAPIALAA